jgi:GNAT superfamily N-acetyltransferase
MVVEPANGDGDEAWLNVVSQGFGVADDVMRSMLHPAIGRYVVRSDGELAAGGATYQHDGVLGIFGTATLEPFRRRGAQTALVARALADAGPDATLAIATTAPGSTSQRTFERLGFQVMYTRAIMVLPLHGPRTWTSTIAMK